MKKGFTLVELLIVIGILAILATTTVLVLNPAQLLKEARDASRIADFDSLKSALSLYLATDSTPTLDEGADFTCGTNWGISKSGGTPTKRVAATGAAAHAGVIAVDGTGWIAVSFNSITGGSPLSSLPQDPVNDDTHNYQYSCDSTNLTFELNTIMESLRYANTGTDDVESKDGGSSADEYEVGNDPGLNI